MVLTDEGKRQLSLGELRFVHYSFFDDAVDYDPYVSNSSSLSEQELSSSKRDQTESFLALEAVTGLSYKRLQNDLDTVNVNKHLFTMPQSQKVLPRASFDPLIVSGTIQVDQQKIVERFVKKDLDGNVLSSTGPYDKSFVRHRTSNVTIDVGIDDFFPDFMQSGFQVLLLKSGSDGLELVEPKRDSLEDDCYGADLKLLFDEKFRNLDRRLRFKK